MAEHPSGTPLPRTSGWPFLLLALLCTLLLPAWPEYRLQEGNPDDRHAVDDLAFHRERLRAIRPDDVFVGNSMLASRIDPAYFTRRTGRSVHLLEKDMSYSAIWYVLLRDALQASGVHPRRVFLFFRDHHLTDPGLDAGNPEGMRLAATLPEALQSRLAPVHRGWVQRLRDRLHRIYPALHPLSTAPSDARWILGNVALIPVLPGFFTAWMHRNSQPDRFERAREARDAFHQGMDALFHLDRMKSVPAESTLAAHLPPRALDFEVALPDSFLLPILEMAAKAQWKLVFVRVKRRPGPDGVRHQSRELKRYIADLERHLKGRGHALIDFTDDPFIEERFYQLGDHIGPAYRHLWMDHFLDRLGEVSG